MLNTPLSPWPVFAPDELEAANRVLQSGRVNYWTGEECREFEREFAAWCGTSHAIALANGTVALDLALKGLDIGPGDEVIVTPRSFIASASCIVNAGARPVFADVDRDSGNITAATIASVVSEKTKAVIAVHLAGWPCDMDPIMTLAEAKGLKVIEDCAQAHGARYKGRSVGSLGHVAAWSFCQDKIMSTGGEGGMVTTDDRFLWRKMWSFKDHGKDWDAVYRSVPEKGFRWVHNSFGTNWRMLEVQGAIGRAQLRKMESWTSLRNGFARRIWNACRRHAAVRVPDFRCDRRRCGMNCAKKSGCVHACYKCYVYVQPNRLADGWDVDRILTALNASGVPCYQGTCPEVYREKCFEKVGFRPAGRLAVAQELGETSIMFLVHPTLTETEIDRVCRSLDSVLDQATNPKLK
jgi:dTDP-4-amino-4,6-dideoxygalactose transaminase